MGELTEKEVLYNEILKTVKKYGGNMLVGAVRAVLAEVDGDIARKAGSLEIRQIQDRLREKVPYEP